MAAPRPASPAPRPWPARQLWVKPRANRRWGRAAARARRITALDMFIVEDNGPYGPMGDYRAAGNGASLVWQPLAMRWRGVAVITNTPPRSQQRSPGDMQANGIMDPVVTKAAKKLGIDPVAIRRINAPEGKALYGPPDAP